MNAHTIIEIEHRLAKALIKLRANKDPRTRRTLLKEMRALIGELDQLVQESIERSTKK